MNKKHIALDKYKLLSHSLRNRAVVAPMSRVSTEGDGVPTLQMADYYEQFSAGGFGTVITEGVYTDPYFSQAYPN